MKKLAIIGSGDLANQIAYHAKNDGHYLPVGCFDDFSPAGTIKHGLQVLGALDDIETAFNNGVFDVLMVGIGYRHFELRAGVFERFKGQIPFANIIHSSSYVDRSCKIGEGVIIYPGCVLDMNAVIGDNVLINVSCTIAHDSSVGDHSFLSPGVKMAGFIKVGKKVSLGIGSILIDNLTIADKVKTAGGAVVTKSIEKPGLYAGVPAIFKKELDV